MSLACQAVLLERATPNAIQCGAPPFYSGVAAFAFRCAPREGWSRGDYAAASASDNEPSLLNFGSTLSFGAEGIRTPDPHNAIVVLYQLSYDPG